MPEEPEIETNELKETLDELQEERREREEEAKKASWVRYISLSTAILAVFAAIGALQAGALVNEAMLKQLKASDTWNEYQADKQKDHLYTLQANALLDAGAHLAARPEKSAPLEAAAASGKSPADPPAGEAAKVGASGEHGKKAAGEKKGEHAKTKPKGWSALPADQRVAQYVGQVEKEAGKEEKLQETARDLEKESREDMERHEQFARSVALIQVAIALSAVAALTRIKSVWILSMVAGAAGIILFLLGFLAR